MAVAEQPDLSGATPPIVGGFVPTEFSAVAYAFHGGYHWLVEPLLAGGDMTTYPGPGTTTAVAVNVHRIDSAGVDTIYPVEVPIIFGWSSDVPSLRDLCTPYYVMKRTSWGVAMLDWQLASDGTTLWLGVVCKSEDQYPWYTSRFHLPFMSPESLEATSAALGYYAYQGSIFCPGSGSPWDDLGVGLSQRWRPYRLTMYAFDGGGFANIGQIAPAYNNEGVTVGGDYGPMVSGVEMCASAAEPGVCHAVWAETGQWGQRDLNPPDGFWPNRGSRLSYSVWSSGGQVGGGDLGRNDFLDIGPYLPPNRPAGVNWLTPSRNVGGTIRPWALPMTEASFSFTPIFAIRNDHGSPVLFIAPMKLKADGSSPDNATALLEMWDLSGGVLQALTPALLPQPSETQYVHSGGGGGFTVDRIPSISGVDSSQPFRSGTRFNALAVSRVYHDPLLGGQAVYLVNVVFENSASPGTRVQGIYRVPCDGSGPFTVLDGDRNLGILPNTNHRLGGFFPHRDPWVPIFDFLSETKSVWVPSDELFDGFSEAGLIQLDRVCAKDWIITELGTSNAVGICDRSGVHYDPAAAKFFYGANQGDVGQTKIVPLVCGPQGIHILERPPGHR